jgi:hypothetical protein
MDRHSTSIWSITAVLGRGRFARAVVVPELETELERKRAESVVETSVVIAPRSRPLLPRSLPPTTAQVGATR